MMPVSRSASQGSPAPAPTCLLRSVVITPTARGTGAGGHLVRAIEAEARADGAASLWLLTQSAAPFFTKAGFAPAERASAPPVIRDSAQFQGLCPASAALMRKPLDGAAA